MARAAQLSSAEAVDDDAPSYVYVIHVSQSYSHSESHIGCKRRVASGRLKSACLLCMQRAAQKFNLFTRCCCCSSSFTCSSCCFPLFIVCKWNASAPLAASASAWTGPQLNELPSAGFDVARFLLHFKRFFSLHLVFFRGFPFVSFSSSSSSFLFFCFDANFADHKVLTSCSFNDLTSTLRFGQVPLWQATGQESEKERESEGKGHRRGGVAQCWQRQLIRQTRCDYHREICTFPFRRNFTCIQTSGPTYTYPTLKQAQTL